MARMQQNTVTQSVDECNSCIPAAQAKPQVQIFLALALIRYISYFLSTDFTSKEEDDQ
jgi:hypothetical protein